MEDSKSCLKFTEPENKIRKKWLFWCTLLPTFVLGCIIIIAAIDFVINADLKKIAIFLVFLLPAGALYMNYHCAYKNPGTILLLLKMIGISLNLLVFFLSLKNLTKESIGCLLFILVIILFQAIVFYYSYKLRKVNKKMHQRKLKASPLYINALSIFSTATNLEELNEQFTKLRISHDQGSAVEALATAYNQQKKILTLANSVRD